jgi:hypothetical protein
MTSKYSPPVDQLLTLGDPRGEREWPDYLALGLTPEHIPELIRMALDEDLQWADSESREVWANLHAWRTLGQLHAQAAIEPLLQLLPRTDEDEDDWVDEELSDVYGMIGPAAIPALTKFLADPAYGLYAHAVASNGIVEIARQHPQVRSECIAAISHQLEQFAENDPTLNGFLVADLLDLDAVETAPTIERAFAAQRIDESVAGDWEDVQIEFRMIDQRKTSRKYSIFSEEFDQMIEPIRDPEHDQRIDRVIYGMLSDGTLKLPTQPESDQPKEKKHKKKQDSS